MSDRTELYNYAADLNEWIVDVSCDNSDLLEELLSQMSTNEMHDALEYVGRLYGFTFDESESE